MNFSLADSLATALLSRRPKMTKGWSRPCPPTARGLPPLWLRLLGGRADPPGWPPPGKVPFVHADLIDGLSAREVAVDFIAAQTAAAGIISTKPALIRRARELGLCAVQRFFVLDSIALENLKRQLENTRPDSIEILPGVMPKVIRRITGFARVPVIAGGLISDKEDIIAALDAGAAAISSTNPAIWFL